MAIMYPKGGPVNNASYTAEPTVYYALARQLSDDFVVIHSIPWLAQVAQEVAQVRRGIHGLAQWVFKASSISYRFGLCTIGKPHSTIVHSHNIQLIPSSSSSSLILILLHRGWKDLNVRSRNICNSLHNNQ